jgi:hypothetical protein
MGMILEFYRLSDEKIIELKNQSEKFCSEYLEENYASVYGKEHKENDTVFSLDKTWDVIRFLITEADETENKILSELYGESLNKKSYDNYNFLLSKKVKVISYLLQEIQTKDLFKFYDEVKMENQMIYKASGFHQDFLEEQIEIVKLAFEKAVSSNSGLIVNIG